MGGGRRKCDGARLPTKGPLKRRGGGWREGSLGRKPGGSLKGGVEGGEEVVVKEERVDVGKGESLAAKRLNSDRKSTACVQVHSLARVRLPLDACPARRRLSYRSLAKRQSA